MDTLRADICYRPLRVGWVVKSGDFSALRKAIGLSYTLWGGRYNPILVADNEEEAFKIASSFRVDMLWPISDHNELFLKKFPHLIKPFFHETLFLKYNKNDMRAQLLDVHNALAYLRDKPEQQKIISKDFRLYDWQNNDPLHDIFSIQFGR